MTDTPVLNSVRRPAAAPPQVIADGRAVLRDPGAASLRRYLPVLAVIAAPYAAMGSGQDPLNPLDRVMEWDMMRAGLLDAAARGSENAAPLALVRLTPPTSQQLAEALSYDGPDAFRVVHFVCHGERDMLYLEDENGHESYAVAEHIANLFKPSGAHVVILDGCFSEHMARLLVDEAGVQAVIGTRRKVLPANAQTFAAQFYAALAEGATIRRAYRGALAALKQQENGQADRFELVEADALDALDDPAVPLPPAEARAGCPLVVSGDPLLINLPQRAGFIGRRVMLSALAQDPPGEDPRVIAFEGGVGLGKTWLAAEVAGRFAWRYPGGVLWVTITACTLAREIAGQVAQLAGLSPYSAEEAVIERLKREPTLIVLDQVDQLAGEGERAALRALIGRLAAGTQARVILTAPQARDLLPPGAASRVDLVEPFPPKMARVLALRLAVERRVEALDVDTIDDFLERTHHAPWMIEHGVRLAGAEGLAGALEELASYKPDMPEPLALYLRRRITLLAGEPDSAVGLLVRAQHLPDAFDRDLARMLLGGAERAPAQIDTLLRYHLLLEEDGLLRVPPVVRAQAAALNPLSGAKGDQVDSFIMRALVQGWASAPERPLETPLSRREQTWLNNTRAVIRRQVRADSALPRGMVARLLVMAAPAYRRAGLADEFWRSAQPVRETLGEGSDYARLQIAMGEALSLLPGRREEAGYLLQMTQALAGVDRNVLAGASRAYGDHLMAAGEVQAAEETLGAALKALLAGKSANVRVAAALAESWARALVMQKRTRTALSRYEAALAGYHQAGMSARALEVQRDLGGALLRLGEVDRAASVLNDALAVPCGIEPPLRGQITFRLALAHLVRAARAHRAGHAAERDAAWAAAETNLRAALPDLLAGGTTGEFGVDLAQAYHELGRLLARRGEVAEATRHVERSRALVERAGNAPELASALLTLGKLRLAADEPDAALDLFRRALALAGETGDASLSAGAADLIVRAHQIDARHVLSGDAAGREAVLARLEQSREALARAQQPRLVEALDSVRRAVSAG